MTAIEDVYPPGHGTPEDPGAASGRPASTVRDTDHRAAWDALVDVLEQAADEPKIAELIGRIGHTVLISSIDVPGSGVLLVCRDERIDVQDADGPSSSATIELALRTPDIEKLTVGRLRTAMAIADGRATFTGPVREFLRVLPLVQAMVNPPVPMGTNTEDIAKEII